jgi:hypothetical protein
MALQNAKSLGALALVIVVIGPCAMATEPPIRLAVEVPAGQVSLWRGIRFGLEEARQTAALLRRQVEIGEPARFTIRGPVVTVNGLRISPRRADKLAWLPTLERFGAGELNERFLRRTGHRMDEQAWLGWLAVKLATEAALRNRELSKIRVDGHKGVALYFDAAGELVQPLYDKR